MPQTYSISNVVPLRPAGALHCTAPCGAMNRYWSGLRRSGDVPWRHDLDPHAMSGLLPYAFLVDRVRPGTLRFRLGGRHIVDLMGMEVRGMPLRTLFEIPDRARLTALAEQVFTDPATLSLELTSDGQSSPVLAARMSLLPLRGRSGAVDRAIGVLKSDGCIGLTPRRFRILDAHLAPLDTRHVEARPGRRRPALHLVHDKGA